ncbi:uncharacterized protein LOC108834110 [Raphanus sativus]|uniref:Uncharacterized protein LOC108834110 n=1 Tax=Raphanus sativus TaxID=3726 RepID=A0A6J0LT88_RAPSA|nr:uncharacterized protein LOC108834110 [Raphanus sativus]
MVVCEVRAGTTASFWFDNWTSLGPLIELVGENGPMVSGLSINAVVADALTSEGWWLDRSRSRSPTITLLKECLPDAQEIIDAEEDDKYWWFPQPGQGTGVFSTSETWRVLHPSPVEVFWHKAIWFNGRIPKHAFISWIAARNRMVTRDRLISWGLQVPSSCVLCSGSIESRQHLFFNCSFSSRVWNYFMSKMNLAPPHDFEAVLRWLVNPAKDKNLTLVVRLVFQAVLYLIWKERNRRIHSVEKKSTSTLIAEIQQTIKLRLDPLARRQRLITGQDSVLAV